MKKHEMEILGAMSPVELLKCYNMTGELRYGREILDRLKRLQKIAQMILDNN